MAKTKKTPAAAKKKSLKTTSVKTKSVPAVKKKSVATVKADKSKNVQHTKSPAKPSMKSSTAKKEKTVRPAAKSVVAERKKPAEAPLKKNTTTAVSTKKVAASSPAKKAVSNEKVSVKGNKKEVDKIPVETPQVVPSKKASSKNVAAEKPKPVTAGAAKPAIAEKPEPLQIKAERAIREMEETMDMSKVKPRIQAGSPKPVHKPVVHHVRLPEPTNTGKQKFQLEFEFKASPKILFNYISDPSGLAGWFADEVKTRDGIYTFGWEGSESNAKLVATRDMMLVRFQWQEETDGTYFQFEIKEDDITGDVALLITDFSNPGEKETNMRLWDAQILKLRMLLGSF